MPNTFYHATIKPIEDEVSFAENIMIFHDLKEYKEYLIQEKRNIEGNRYPKGRIRLDSAFHGFYLTPSLDVAKKWVDGDGTIIEFKFDKSILSNDVQIESYCFPDLNWAKFIINNRKSSNNANSCKISYSMQMDGETIRFHNLIDSAITDEDYRYLRMRMVREWVKQKSFVGEYCNLNLFRELDSVKDHSLFQLCISSSDLLNSIHPCGKIKVQGGMLKL